MRKPSLLPAALRKEDPPPPSEKISWSLADTARSTGLSVRTIQSAIAGGEIRAVRVGRRVLLLPERVKDWLAARES